MTRHATKRVRIGCQRINAYLPKDTEPLLIITLPVKSTEFGPDILDAEEVECPIHGVILRSFRLNQPTDVNLISGPNPGLWFAINPGVSGFVVFEDGNIPSLTKPLVVGLYRDLSFGDNSTQSDRIVLKVTGYENLNPA